METFDAGLRDGEIIKVDLILSMEVLLVEDILLLLGLFELVIVEVLP